LIVILGAGILVAGLVVALRIVGLLQVYDLARPWILLSVLISFFFLGYVFTALRFLGVELLPGITLEGLVTAIFFFGALFVLALAFLNINLIRDIFGKKINDPKAYQIFAEHIGMPAKQVMAMTRPLYAVASEICGGDVEYSIPEIIRTHPRRDRGVLVERAMGGTNYRFFVRHYCGKE
jgi:hypothetical protein